ncbi:M91 family zinc metallopeptidase [Pseudomonas sp. TAE6080]|uniref:M91 family zinc metallopeptidase n=1 Tax=Pseudomonas sp. TAE6080 TaxID=2840374 RepID=UPI001C005F3F|nr:M91 family zinc metallopeptidase [Pseudomonas sp. TAE6080]MBT9300129.1 hemolysin [Pseudomonas sp. TAE6080]
MKTIDRPPSSPSNTTQYPVPSSNGLPDGVKKQNRDFSNTLTISEIKKPKLGIYPDKEELSKKYPLLSDRNVTVSRELKWVYEAPKTKVKKDRLVIETTSHADTVHVKKANNKSIDIIINGKTYHIDSQQRDHKIPEIHIKTLGGDDHVWVDPDVSERMLIETGDGADYVQAGSGYTRVLAGAGNDTVRLGSGFGYAEGGKGDDVLIAGRGMGALYGNDGKDRMFAGYFGNTQRTYMDGGRGNDEMYAKGGRTIMHGGLGNNFIMSCGGSHIYTGKEKNRVISLSDTNTIFAKTDDTVQRTSGSKLVEAKYSDAGHEGLKVSGTPEFKQRIADDLELLRLSPTGQKMLKELDEAYRRNIAPAGDTPSAKIFNMETGQFEEDQSVEIKQTDDDNGHFFFRDISVNPSYIETKHQTFPISVLYHEMAHAYNSVNESEFKGKTKINDGPKGLEDNIERQAVGLWTNESFDFDGDPSTPRTFTNPKPFTENGLHEEMGEPLRKAYHIENVV